MILLLVLFFLSLALLASGFYYLGTDKREGRFGALLFAILGFVLINIVTFTGAPVELPSGLPKTSIKNGNYEVAFINPRGVNVNVGIIKKEDTNERLYLYQFPRKAFDTGSFRADATALIVVEVDGFRKLVLNK